MIRRELKDAQWARIERLVPGKEGDKGRHGTDNRLFVDAVLWIARTGMPARVISCADSQRKAAFDMSASVRGARTSRDFGPAMTSMPKVSVTFEIVTSTPASKANMLKAPWNNDSGYDFYEAIKPRADKGEIWITNGRVNETWQSGFDDLRKPYLAKRWPWPHIVIHPDDAAPQGIESGDLVEGFNDTVCVQTGEPIGVKDDDLSFTKLMEHGHIKTATGQFVAVAIVSDEIRPGVAKTAFNYPGSMANSVCHAAPNPVSGN